MKKQTFLFVMLVGMMLVLAACSPKAAEPVVTAGTVEPDLLIAEGRLLPVNTMEQSFAIPGQVAEVLVKDGDVVQSGQVLARLTVSPEAQLALARAQQEALVAQQALDGLETAAKLNLAQAGLGVIQSQLQLETAQEKYDADESDENRAALSVAVELLAQAEEKLAKLDAGAGVDPDQLAAAEARISSASAALTSAQAALEARELKSSMDGTLVDVSLMAGQRVTAGQAVLTLADFSAWVVKTDNLTETDVTAVKVGQTVEVILDALPELTLKGEVTRINARFEEKRGDITYTVTIALTDADPRLLWGMTAAVQFLP